MGLKVFWLGIAELISIKSMDIVSTAVLALSGTSSLTPVPVLPIELSLHQAK